MVGAVYLRLYRIAESHTLTAPLFYSCFWGLYTRENVRHVGSYYRQRFLHGSIVRSIVIPFFVVPSNMAASILEAYMATHSSLPSTTTPSTVPEPPMRDLANILNLNSSSEGFSRCVGWAHTQGRRCRNPIAAHNQAAADSLLAKGSQKLSASQSVDSVLRKLAPLVLCRRWHQDQAGEMTAKWAQKVASYQESRRAEPTSTVSTTSLREMAEQSRALAEQIDLLRQQQTPRLVAATPPTTEQGEHSSPISQGGHRQLRIEASEAHERPESRAQSSSQVQEAESRDEVEDNLQLRPDSVDRAASETPPEPDTSSQETDPAPDLVPAGTPLISEDVPEPSPQDRTTADEATATTSTAARKPVVDESCYICYSDLLDDSQQDTVAEVMALHQLVWCKAQCGVNFHRECIGKWSSACASQARTTTCPNW